MGEGESISPSKFSLIAETTSCHEERTGGGRDSSAEGRGRRMEDLEECPYGQRLLTLREVPWKSWKRYPPLPYLHPSLHPELKRSALEEGKPGCLMEGPGLWGAPRSSP